MKPARIYHQSIELAKRDPPFYALIMAAMRKADSTNLPKLREAFPDVWLELNARYHAPGGLLPPERTTAPWLEPDGDAHEVEPGDLQMGDQPW